MTTVDVMSVDAIFNRRMQSTRIRQALIDAETSEAMAEKARLKAKYEAKAVASSLAQATI